MYRHARLRKRIKWGGAVILALIVVLRIASDVQSFEHVSSSGWWVTFSRGWIDLTIPAPNVVRIGDRVVINGPAVIQTKPDNHWYNWAVRWAKDSVGTHAGVSLTLPFWLVVYITGFAWYVDAAIRRQPRRNSCGHCGYDRTGLAITAKCPECGEISAPE